MGDDEAAFQEFATAAMAQAAGTAPELVAPAPAETPAAEPAAEPAKEAPATEAKEPEPAKPEEKKEEIPAWKKAAEAERAKRASKSNETKLQARLAAVEAELGKYKAFEAKKETDPLSAAAEMGLDYERLTKEYIKTLDKDSGPKVDPEVQKLYQKIQQVEGLLKQQQQAIEQRGQAEAVQAFNAELKSELETKGDALEYVKSDPQGPSLVWEIRVAHYRETAPKDASGNIIGPGEIMSVGDACELAEKHLEKYLGNFKNAKKLTGKVEAPKPAAKPAATPTLSQDMRQQSETKSAPHGDEIEQLLALKKTLEAQLDAQRGN
jgi:hypothetical protein